MAAIQLLQRLRAQNDQREAEMRRVEAERKERAEKALNTGQSLLRGMQKPNLKDIEPFLIDDLDSKGLAILRFEEKQLKEQMKQQEEAGAASALKSQLPGLAGLVQGTNDPRYAHAVSALGQTGLSPETLTPLLEEFAVRAQMSPIDRLIQESALKNKLAETEALKELEARIARESDVAKARELQPIQVETARQSEIEKLTARRDSALIDESRKARLSAEAQSLAGSMLNSPQSVPAQLKKIQDQLENPALEMPILIGEASKVAAAASSASSIQQEFRAQGFNVSPALAREVVDGKASIDEFSGMISRDFGDRGDDMRQARATSMYELIELREIARKVVTGPLRNKTLKERWMWAAEQFGKYQAGEADPLYTEFRNRRDRFVNALARSMQPGVLSNQDMAFTQALVSQPRMLAGNETGTDLSQQLNANLNSLFAAVEGRYRSAIPRDAFPDPKFRSVMEQRKKEHAEQFRASYLDSLYPSAPSADGWEVVE